MGSRYALAATMLCACNAQLGMPAGGHPDGQQGPPADSAHGIDAPASDAPLGAWGSPAAVNGASDTGLNEDDCTLNSTQTELYFKKLSAAGTDYDLYELTRATPADAWGPPIQLAILDSAANEESPRLSPDNLRLYFGRAGDIYVSTRATTTSPWGSPSLVTGVSVAGVYEKWLAVCNNDYFMVSRAVSRGATTDQDLFVGHLDGTDPGTLAGELSMPTYNEISSFLSNDCLTAYFASNRSGNVQIYTAQRLDTASPFGPVATYEYFGTATDDEDPWESADQRTFVFASIRGGSATKAVYMSTR